MVAEWGLPAWLGQGGAMAAGGEALLVAMSGVLAVPQAMVLHAVWDLARIALLAVSVVEAQATAPCRMLVLVRASTSRTRRTNTSGSGETLMWSGLGETSLASSQV